MKKIINWTFTILFSIVILMYVGTVSVGAPSLAYVYSESMEPLIKVNDGFVVLPAMDFKVGDIIVYRPAVLDAELITHRVVAVGEEGWITQGDNSPATDQQAGEPEVGKSNIVGKVLVLGGKPLIIPGLGNLLGGLEEYKTVLRIAAGGIIILALIVGIVEKRSSRLKRKPNRRWTIRTLYRATAVLLSLLLFLSLVIGSKVESVRYLVSQNPGASEEQFALNQYGQMTYTVNNLNIFPSWFIVDPVEPTAVVEAPAIIPPLGEEQMLLEIPPHKKTGWYNGYFYVYKYPILLPRSVTVFFHEIHPYLGFMATTLAGYLYSELLYAGFSRLLNIEQDLPVKAMKNKGFLRKLRRIRIKILGE